MATNRCGRAAAPVITLSAWASPLSVSQTSHFIGHCAITRMRESDIRDVRHLFSDIGGTSERSFYGHRTIEEEAADVCARDSATTISTGTHIFVMIESQIRKPACSIARRT